MLAIIELAGRQYPVQKGTKLRCQKLQHDISSTFSAERVLMVKDGEKVQVGQPYLNGVDVKIKILGHGRAKKIIGLKYKSKVNYRRHYGHRQHFTTIQIEEISC